MSSSSARRFSSSYPTPETLPEVEHFVRAQAGIGVWGETYDEALRELRQGRKRGHWIWYVFPQVVGLSMSSMGQRFSIHSLAEARAYLAHPILSVRLKEAAQAVLDAETEDIEELFGGSLDAQKFRSSMTLFAIVAEGAEKDLFGRVLGTYWDGEMDEMTMDILHYEPSQHGSDMEKNAEGHGGSGSSVDEEPEQEKANDQTDIGGNAAEQGKQQSKTNDRGASKTNSVEEGKNQVQKSDEEKSGGNSIADGQAADVD